MGQSYQFRCEYCGYEAMVSGGDRQKLEDRSLEIVRFVVRQTREHGSRPAWSKLLERWHQEHPNWRYGSYRGFAQTFRRSFERIVYPEYNRPKWQHRSPEDDEARHVS